MVSVFGSQAVAGYTIAVRIFIFTLMPAWGLSGAAATLVGQNLGARQPERAERSAWITGWVNMAFLAAVSLVYIFCNELLVRIFTNDAAVLAAGAHCLRVVGYGFIAYASGIVELYAFYRGGEAFSPTNNRVFF